MITHASYENFGSFPQVSGASENNGGIKSFFSLIGSKHNYEFSNFKLSCIAR